MPLRAPGRVSWVEGTARAMNAAAPDLSIVIPSYNEELRLPATLEQIAAFLPSLGGETEILVIDDGSKDRTAEVAESFLNRLPLLRIIPNDTNRAKGFSVRHGMI